MTYNLKNIWKQCLDSLKKVIQKTFYDAFIQPLQLIALTDTDADFTVSEQFMINTIENKYYNDISKALTETTGKEFKLHFTLQSEYEKNKPTDTDNTASSDFSNFRSHLNPRYTFDSFIIGNSNRMAHAAALAISMNPGKSYNPFFIYGKSGLGKTHLMHAIGNQILLDNPSKKILYVTTETFTNEFIDSITYRTNEAFRNKYRKIDLLLIDDIQFISKTQSTQEEFFNTFNTLHEHGKQIVISCDRPVNELHILEERLRTRFACGLIADVQVPDFETKVAILTKKASENDFSVENDILDYIANCTGESIRELEGVINHLSISLAQGREINMKLAKEALRHLQKKDVHEITAGVIIDVVSRYYGVSVEDILSKKRNRDLVMPRHIALYLCRTLTNLSYPQIGAAFNGIHYSSVMGAYSKIDNQIKTNQEITVVLEELKRTLLR